MPYTTPEMKEYGFAISPGTENFLSIRPDVLHSHEAISKISYNRYSSGQPLRPKGTAHTRFRTWYERWS